MEMSYRKRELHPFRLLAPILMLALMLALPTTAHAYAAPAEDDAKPASRVVVSGYSVADGGLEAGRASTASITLHNTAKTAVVSSLLVTGWVETGAPVEIVGVNQVYVPLIRPDGEATVEFDYYTKNVDLASIDTISAGFTITYYDEGSAVERTNSVSLRLPVLESSRAAVDEAEMRWREPTPSSIDRFLNSNLMQLLYFTGLAVCAAGIAILVLLKLKSARWWRRIF